MRNNIEVAEKMVEALNAEKIGPVRELLDAGYEVEQTLRRDDNHTALHLAAGIGFERACRLLLDRGADVNARCRIGVGALHFAANREHHKVCVMLISAGADVHMKCYKNETALHWASLGGCTKSCEILVRSGANTDAEDRLGQTPLHFAKNPETFAYLLSAGALPFYAPRKTTKDYLTPFQHAVASGWAEQVELCLARPDVDLAQRTLDGRTLTDLVGRRVAIRELVLKAKAKASDPEAGAKNTARTTTSAGVNIS